jgi:dipeptidyl aminopeptidase/acylaminoacyl peptidase
MKNIPVYIYHGMRDETVMPLRSMQMYNALKDVGNKEVVLVAYPELGHVCWNEAFSTPGLFKWLFGKRR